jgi:hypothetical protein
VPGSRRGYVGGREESAAAVLAAGGINDDDVKRAAYAGAKDPQDAGAALERHPAAAQKRRGGRHAGRRDRLQARRATGRVSEATGVADADGGESLCDQLRPLDKRQWLMTGVQHAADDQYRDEQGARENGWATQQRPAP